MEESGPLKPPVTLGDLKSEIARLRKDWEDDERVRAVLDFAIGELTRISQERADYYGSFGL
jgi:hypothetical protein